MQLDGTLRSLIQRMVVTERQSRGRRFVGALRAAESDAAANGRLGAGFYAADQERRCGEELEARVASWMEIAARTIDETGQAWTNALAEDVFGLIEAEGRADSDSLVELLRTVVKPHGHKYTFGHLDESRQMAFDRAKQELELRVIRQDRTTLPLQELLQAPRYADVSKLWVKANNFLHGAKPDPENAAKEAVSAVEALARVIVEDPGLTLGEAIKVLRSRQRVTAPVLKGIEEIWGFTNNAQSVRHGGGAGARFSSAEAQYVMELAAAALRMLLLNDTA